MHTRPAPNSARSPGNGSFTAILMFCVVTGCAGTTASDDPAEEMRGTPITYPFAEETQALDRDPPQEKFVIRSAMGAREYAIEIPGGAQDFDVQVPIGAMGEKDPDVLSGAKPKNLPNPRQTDMELMGVMPRLEKDRGADASFMDQAFGVSSASGPAQGPSYTLGIARISRYYKERQLEYCLVEINNLLSFYPNATQLHKMKGTVLLKMRQFKLAENAWIKALQLDPTDRGVKNALARLQKRWMTPGPNVEKSPSSPKVGPPQVFTP